MLADDKQARENTPGVYAELVDRLYAQSEVSRGEGWDEVAKLDADAGKVIESLSAQVAERLRERDQAYDQCTALHQQVAELQKENVALKVELDIWKHRAHRAGFEEDLISTSI